MNIAEWIANIFILGIAGIIWVAVFFGCALLINIATQYIQETFGGD
jgi:hypothetical protein